MTDSEIRALVAKFERAWATREDAEFLAIWHPDGELHSPFNSRVLLGRELPLLNAVTRQNAPELQWRLVGWTARDHVVVVEWECSNRYGDRVVTWRGMDRLTIVDGRIREEIVYADTAPLQAMRRGERFAALIPVPAPAG
jgi:hypothetical protein